MNVIPFEPESPKPSERYSKEMVINYLSAIKQAAEDMIYYVNSEIYTEPDVGDLDDCFWINDITIDQNGDVEGTMELTNSAERLVETIQERPDRVFIFNFKYKEK